MSDLPTKISQLEDDSNFVVKEEGKSLTSNDFTDEDKQNLDTLVNASLNNQSD
jgi:hypothetical protein